MFILFVSSFILSPFSSFLLAADGGRPGGIFNFGAGARALGMGGAYSATARDVTALYYNPAGLSFMSNRNVSLMHATLFEGAAYDYLGYGQNFGTLPGAWGAQVMRLGLGGADGRDENNQPAGGFSYSETAFSLGTGIRGILLPFLSAGASVKTLSRKLAGSSDALIAFDLGFQYGPLYDGRLNAALVAENFGSFASGDTDDKLPLSYKLGAAYALTPGMVLCADLLSTGELRFGTEYLIGPGAIRLGYDKNAFSLGTGIKFLKSYQLDYAMFKHPVLGLSNRLSLAYFFGGYTTAPPKIRRQSEDYLGKAEAALRLKDYVGAMDAVTSAIGMNPEVTKGPWGEKMRRLERVTKGLDLRAMPERQRQLKAGSEQTLEANRALYEFVSGNGLKSALLAHSALGYQPNSAFYTELLTLVCSLTSVEKRDDEILPRVALVQEKLNKSEAAFYRQQFDFVIRQCEEVLLLDENNALAWSRLGSAYYAMGDLSKARSAYETAVKLDPQDETTLRFMKMQGWR